MSNMKLYTITHSPGGVTLINRIVSNSIVRATQKSCELLQDNVGDNFKGRMLSGEYITNIDIVNIQHVDT